MVHDYCIQVSNCIQGFLQRHDVPIGNLRCVDALSQSTISSPSELVSAPAAIADVAGLDTITDLQCLLTFQHAFSYFQGAPWARHDITTAAANLPSASDAGGHEGTATRDAASMPQRTNLISPRQHASWTKRLITSAQAVWRLLSWHLLMSEHRIFTAFPQQA